VSAALAGRTERRSERRGGGELKKAFPGDGLFFAATSAKWRGIAERSDPAAFVTRTPATPSGGQASSSASPARPCFQ
jgi:hypothetical protein